MPPSPPPPAPAGNRNAVTHGYYTLPEDATIDDAILHFEAKARLLDELGWAAIGIDVDSMDGRIVLTGEVPVRADRELADELEAAVTGDTVSRPLSRPHSRRLSGVIRRWCIQDRAYRPGR